jgi:hypothetical protein
MANSNHSTRVPIDLPQATNDIKNRVHRVIGGLTTIAQYKDPIFQDPRNVWFELTLAVHELEAAIMVAKRSWWGA